MRNQETETGMPRVIDSAVEKISTKPLLEGYSLLDPTNVNRLPKGILKGADHIKPSLLMVFDTWMKMESGMEVVLQAYINSGYDPVPVLSASEKNTITAFNSSVEGLIHDALNQQDSTQSIYRYQQNQNLAKCVDRLGIRGYGIQSRSVMYGVEIMYRTLCMLHPFSSRRVNAIGNINS